MQPNADLWAPMTTPSYDILFEQRDIAGIVTLNRPQALNAVTHQMLLALETQLKAWESDPTILRVIVKAVPGKAFSAGGDIRHLYERGMAGEPDFQFFADEYRINAYIQNYPKPYIALIDGIVMGGGVGVSIHGSHRVAGDNIAFAMPEVGIGFFPDVGGAYFLPRLPGQIGLYLGLTGSRIRRDDCSWSGIATHACGSSDLAELERLLCERSDLDSILAPYLAPQTASAIQELVPVIDEVFSAPSIIGIIDRLRTLGSAGNSVSSSWAQKCLATILTKSPTSLEVAFRQIRRGKSLSMAQCMKMEFRILCRILAGGEFYEGIRAAIIDKDGKPKWNPAKLEQISNEEIESVFSPLDVECGQTELALP